MDYNDISLYYTTKKRGPSSDDYMTLEAPRKKFISEENFARDMAAMSINPNNEPYQSYFQPFSEQARRDSDNKNVIHIDDIDQYLTEEDGVKPEQQQKYKMIHTIVNGKSVYDSDVNGLPLVMAPGDEKPRIPDFVLKNTSLADPRDRLAYERLLKSMQRPHHKKVEIEVLNAPSTHYTPMAMDID